MQTWQVTNKSNAGAGSFRQAIINANNFSVRNPGVEQQIIFVTPDDATPNNDGTSYWRLELESALPTIKTGRLLINADGVKPILLAPKSRNQILGALLQIGESEDRLIRSNTVTGGATDVVLKNVHFAQSIAKGANASDTGQGGALGAGAGIVHFSGDIELIQSTFQDLSAEGGNGFARDENASYDSKERGGWVRKARSGNDRWAGNQNLFASESNAQTSNTNNWWAEYAKALASFDLKRADEVNGYIENYWNSTPNARTVHGPWVENRYNGSRTLFWTDGRTATRAADNVGYRPPITGHTTPDVGDPSQPLFGAGGSTGGRGMSAGGGTHNRYDNKGWNNSRRWWSNRRNGVNGGNGSAAGFGGGGGGGGGAGAGEAPQTGGVGGASFAYGSNGENGGNSTTGFTEKARNERNEEGEERDSNLGGITGSGGKGASLGGAIFSYSNNGNIKLSNVDFINSQLIQPSKGNGTSAQLGEAIFSHGTNIYLDNVQINGRDISPSNAISSNSIYTEGNSQISSYTPQPAYVNSGNFMEATSTVFNQEIAKLRAPELKGKVGKANRFVLNYEQEGSGVRGIKADLTSENSAFNQLWRQLVPDREDEIRAAEPAGLSFTGLVGHLGKDVVGIGLDAWAENRLWTAQYGSRDPGTSFLNTQGFAVGSTVALGLASSAFNYFTSHKNAVLQWENDLEENAKQQKQLASYLEDNHNQLSVGDVNIRENRTLIKVVDFELGVDSLYMPLDGVGNGRSVVLRTGLTDAETGRQGFTIQYQGTSASSTPQVFAQVFLDKASEGYLNSQTSLQDLLNRLLVRPDQSGTGGWVLGTSFVRPDDVSSRFYSGPNTPIDLRVRFDESRAQVGNDETVDIELGIGNDQYVGSKFSEIIRANDGDDIITPIIGEDIVLGGNGLDMTSYEQLGGSVTAKAINNADGRNGINVKWLEEEVDFNTVNNKLNSNLFGVEILALDGINNIDYSGLEPIENRKGAAYFGLKTGAGSHVKGSDSKDIINILYEVPQHLQIQEPGDPIRSNFNPFDTITLIDAGEGVDSLVTSFQEYNSGGVDVVYDNDFVLTAGLKGSKDSLLQATGIESLVLNTTEHNDSVNIDGLTGLNLKLLSGDDYVQASLDSHLVPENIFVDLGAGNDQAYLNLGDANISKARFQFSDSLGGQSNRLEITDLTTLSETEIVMSDGQDQVILRRNIAPGSKLRNTHVNITNFNILDNDTFSLARDFRTGGNNATLSKIYNSSGLLESVSIDNSAYGKIHIDFATPFLESSSDPIENYILLNQP